MKRIIPRSSALGLVLGLLLLRTASAQAAAPVLIIGDDRVEGRFGQILEQKLFQKDGTPSSRVSACGLGVYDWLNGSRTTCGYFEKKLSGEVIQKKEADVAPFITYLSDVKPEFVVFVHGNRGIDTTAKALQAQIELIGRLLTAGSAGCLWMGPGDEVKARVSDFYYDAVRQAATDAGCAVIDAPLFSTMIENGSMYRDLEPLIDIVVEMISIGRDL